MSTGSAEVQDRRPSNNPFKGPAFLVCPLIPVFVDPDLAAVLADILLASGTTNTAVIALAKDLEYIAGPK